MKNIFLSIALFIIGFLNAQTVYEKTMLEKINQVEKHLSPEEYTTLANQFVRIGEKEKTQWLPYYYAAYANLQKGRLLMQKQTNVLDEIAAEVDRQIEKAESLSANNAELYIIKKMNHGMKMMVNPMARYATEGASASKALQMAKLLDPKNPRIIILEAEDAYFTPEQFGGSKSKGLTLFAEALKQMDIYQPKSKLDPNWGKGEANYFLSLK